MKQIQFETQFNFADSSIPTPKLYLVETALELINWQNCNWFFGMEIVIALLVVEAKCGEAHENVL